jgi:hypothetical protein
MSGSGNCFKQIGSIFCLASKEMEYSMFCKNCSDCFGCVGIKDSKFCILNKQYTEEEYKLLVPKLRQHMMDMPYVDGLGRVFTYGEFYPFEFSPFSYNETVTQYYFPSTESNAKQMGYNWLAREKKDHSITVEVVSLPNSIHDVSQSILNEVIGCSHKGECEHQCTTAFRVVPNELQFLKQKGLPLPTECPNCRHYERISLCNPYKLYKRSCTCDQTTHFHSGNPCPNEFATSYAPDRPEKVYCEQCYQAEVL